MPWQREHDTCHVGAIGVARLGHRNPQRGRRCSNSTASAESLWKVVRSRPEGIVYQPSDARRQCASLIKR